MELRGVCDWSSKYNCSICDYIIKKRYLDLQNDAESLLR